VGKEPGQVAYESMLAQMRARGIVSPEIVVKPDAVTEEGAKAIDSLNGVWSAQPVELREDWAAVETAVLQLAVNALVKAARSALDDYKDTLESEWGPIEEWPAEVLELEAALKPFEKRGG
jgi:hypothetical protein